MKRIALFVCVLALFAIPVKAKADGCYAQQFVQPVVVAQPVVAYQAIQAQVVVPYVQSFAVVQPVVAYQAYAVQQVIQKVQVQKVIQQVQVQKVRQNVLIRQRIRVR